MPTKLTIEWRAAAQDDLLAIVDFISDDSPQAALDLVNEIVEKVNMLPVRPKMYGLSARAAGYRQLTVSANYLVFYRLLPNEKSPEMIDVAGVVHARRQWPT